MKDRLEIGIDDFSDPKEHPYGILEGVDNANEKEKVLVIMLKKNMAAKTLFGSVKTKYKHPTMVEDGLIEECDDGGYRLTPKSVVILHSRYKKDQ